MAQTIAISRPPPPLSEHPLLPPGFRFHPTDEELVVHYLRKKASSLPLPVPIITDINLYKFDPWDLPEMASFGETEWYFFSPRDRKYPNGARPNRAAASGYWKATGTDKPITSAGGSQKIGVKKALVFYKGKPPKGIKTNWIMHEYRLVSAHSNVAASFQSKKSLRLDDWVLCRIYKKNNSVPESRFAESKLCECTNSSSLDHGSLFSAFNNSDADDPFLDNILLEPEFVSSSFSSQINNMNGGIKCLHHDGLQSQSLAMPKSELDVYAREEEGDNGHGEYGFSFTRSCVDFPDITQKQQSQQPAMVLQLNVTGSETCRKWP